MLCEFCRVFDAIENSHVVSDFVIEYLRNNSVGRAFFNTRQNQQYKNRGKFKDWMITGPYLCQKCDNEVFGRWEDNFSRTIFRRPLAASDEWGEDSSLKFIVSICYRFAIHSLVVDKNPDHHQIAILFRDRCKAVLQDPTRVGQTLFVYPYIYQPIIGRSDLKPGINHLLTLSLSDRFRLAADGLPNRYVIQLPSMTFLFSESNLAVPELPGHQDLISLCPGSKFIPKTSNLQILDLYADLMNEGIQETKHHQTATNRWESFANVLDQMLFFTKPIYQAAKADNQLRDWQRRNC